LCRGSRRAGPRWFAEKERPEITKMGATRSVVAHLMPATSSTCDCAQGLTATLSVAMRKSPLVARWRSPLVASESPRSSFVVS
jgi:hypothetical protein